MIHNDGSLSNNCQNMSEIYSDLSIAKWNMMWHNAIIG